MKKSFIYLAAALAFVSCSQNEITEGATTPVNSDVIGFSSSISGTRANDNTIDNLKASGLFVYGLDKDAASLFTNPADGDGSTYSNAYKFTTEWGWDKKTDDKKWPNADTYPLTFIVAYPNPNFLDQVFGTWADGGPNYVRNIITDTSGLDHNGDELAAHSVVTTKPASGMASLSFKHIFSKIQFQIISPTGYKIHIHSLIIKNVAKEGRSYDYSKPLGTAYSEEPATYSSDQIANPIFHRWNHTVELIGAGFAPVVGVDVPSGGPKPSDTWKLMPQKNVPVWSKDALVALIGGTASRDWTAAEWVTYLANDPTVFNGSYIELTYRMEDAAGKSIIGRRSGEVINGTASTSNKYVTVAFPLNIATVNGGLGWEPNKQYTYQIKLGTPDASNGTVIDPNYKNEDGTTSDDYIDNPRTWPGEDITDKDGYIGFDVIVDEWADGGNTGIQ